MSNFLILGLPRSRTAWLANFMTYDGHFCTHEGLDGCTSLQEYKNQFKPFSGDSNTGLALLDFETLFHDFKIVIIDNEIDSAVKFSIKNYGRDITPEMNLLKIRLSNLKGLHVNFKDINERLEDIWNYLSPKQFDDCRAKELVKLRIQLMDVHSFDLKAMQELKNNHDYFTHY